MTAQQRRTVTVTFPTAQPFMIQGLGSCSMICSKGLADRSSLLNGTDGTGPYKLTGAVLRRPLHLLAAEGLHVGPRRRHHRRAVCRRR